MYLVRIMSTLPRDLDIMMRGLAYRATFVIAVFALEEFILAIIGPEMIMLPISSKIRVYARIADTRMLRRKNIENAKLIAADVSSNIRSVRFAYTRRQKESMLPACSRTLKFL